MKDIDKVFNPIYFEQQQGQIFKPIFYKVNTDIKNTKIKTSENNKFFNFILWK